MIYNFFFMMFRNYKMFSRATLTKMNKNENVALSVLVNICRYLKCDIGDIMELLPEGDTD